jgi:hypothetical protein
MSCNDEDRASDWCSLLSPMLLGEIPERQRRGCFRHGGQVVRRTHFSDPRFV